ncbi:hypothetical protein Vadar_001214 [Vaccinium darrowii]|uniref:Uncharacterized protein n=1 Tax=Vaccinium darrowii TaxID=229202 RepID=A0ACB7X6U0_9ERIC|nr:hypothetical protein Vadar_001214 [Vaccinium darrowii]
MDCVQVVDPIGIAGGLAVLWKRDLAVRFIRSSSFFIELEIKDDDSDHVWRLINLYASSSDRVRKLQWEELIRYRQQCSADWIVWGDFNDVLWADEKQGGRVRDVWSLKAFRDFVTNLEAVDLGYCGHPFTWSNRHGGDGMVKERLDRVLASPGWWLRYDRVKVQNLHAVGSDHAALFVDTNPPKFSGPRQFRFDKRWVDDPGCYDVVCKGWQGPIRGSNMYQIFNKVRNTRRELRVWSKKQNFNARRRIKEVQGQLKEIGEEREYGGYGENSCSRKGVRRGVEDIAREFVQYFQSLFQTDGTDHVAEVVGTVKARIDDQMNRSLTRMFSYSEIRQALFDIDPNKAPVKFLKRSKTHNTTSKLPPGPWKLPLVGSIHHLVGSLPHHSLRTLARKYGPLMHLQLGENSTIVISSPRLAKEVMQTHDLAYANRPKVQAAKIMTYNYVDIAYCPYGDYWRQMRKIFMLELLSAKNVRSFCSIREDEVFHLIDSIKSSSGSPINLTEKIFSLTNDITFRAAFGKRYEDKDALIPLIKETIEP